MEIHSKGGSSFLWKGGGPIIEGGVYDFVLGVTT